MLRIIPRLDIKGKYLVKGIHLEGLKVLGYPEMFSKKYYDDGADELIYMDAVASLYKSNSLLDLIERTAKDVFIPLTAGGGIRSLDDISAALNAGSDKVAINSAAVQNPDFINQAANKFGQSTIVISVDIKRLFDGSYALFINNGREKVNICPFNWIKEAISNGAGEIMVTSIDAEGSGKGADKKLLSLLKEMPINIPLIYCGGFGRVEHFDSLESFDFLDGFAIASILHYGAAQNFKEHNGPARSGYDFDIIQDNLSHMHITSLNIQEIKQQLQDLGMQMRMQ